MGDADGVEVGAREGVVVGLEVGAEVVGADVGDGVLAHEWPTNGALQPATQRYPPSHWQE